MRQIRRRAAAGVVELGGGVHPLLQRLYAARGVAHAGELELTLDRLLPVSSLEGVPAAVDLLAAHRVGGRVLIIGDFDADGATGSALLVRALRALRFEHVDFLVPDRFRFGYGLTPEIVALAATRAPTLIVTVDNGISSIEGVAAARALGIPVLITDHHLPGPALPRAEVIVNPNLAASSFGSRALAGVGVAFYVVAALARRLGAAQPPIAELLDLVALGTVADLVPLDRNNRILVAQGLQRMRAGRCVPGIRALLECAQRPLAELSVADLAFGVAPRINAAGRLTDMSIGIACLVTDDEAEAMRLARQLSELNHSRREIEREMQREAVELVASLRVGAAGAETAGVCLFDESWHPGVVGLVAGRLKERLHRPVIAFACGEPDSLRGSARSVDGIHIRDVLESIATLHPGLIRKFGGHAMAAGLTLERARFEEFRAAFAAAVAARADAETLAGILHSDGELTPAELCVATARLLESGGPWGAGFPEPLFDGAFRIADARVVGERHLKMRVVPCAGPAPGGVRPGPPREGPLLERPLRESPLLAGPPLDAIAFGYLDEEGAIPLRAGDAVHLAYRLEVNAYEGRERAQLKCEHLAPLGRAC